MSRIERLQPEDRRCFAFFHPSMPTEPLIFVEVALTKGVPNSIQTLLADTGDALAETEANTAVFYSISNCQSGLAGVSFGNSLIKQVVRDLSFELPSLSSYVTLSPIPGFRRWMESQGLEAQSESDATLKKLAAHYLTAEKASNTSPLDPVAKFHLGNGAQVHALHTGADLSENGQKLSYGTMVNYAYDLKNITTNLRRLGQEGAVASSGAVRTLAKQGGNLLRKRPARETTDE